MNWRRIFLGKLTVSAFLLLAVFYLWLHGLGKAARFRRRLHQAEYFEKSPFRLQQNGDYWILNDFIRASSSPHGHQSVTLTTHGTYMDLRDLERLVVRWNAPISLALFVGPGDFGRIITSFHHLKYCSLCGLGFGRWVSVHLVMHQEYMPLYLRQMEAKHPYGFRCGAPYEMDANASNPAAAELQYPLNLLKNVARLNARTYYVFPLELNSLPVRNFANNFMAFVQYQDFRKPLKSAFCVPVFSQLGEKAYMIKYKSELVAHLRPYMNDSSLRPLSQEQELRDMQFWLNGTTQDDEIEVLRVEKSHQNCLAHVAINAYEPLYDQRLAEPPFARNNSELLVLAGLGLDFVLLDGLFVIHQPRERERSHSRNALTPAKPNRIRDLIKLNSLTMK